MFFSEKTEEFDKLLEKAAQDVDFKVKWIDAGGASDGNHMAEANIPIIDGCGPSGGCLHSADEYIDLNSVPEKIRTITRLLSLI